MNLVDGAIGPNILRPESDELPSFGVDGRRACMPLGIKIGIVGYDLWPDADLFVRRGDSIGNKRCRLAAEC